MKVKFLFIGAVVAMMSLASCRKDYTCTCEWVGEEVEGAAEGTYDDTVLEFENVKKSDAEEACDNANSENLECTLD